MRTIGLRIDAERPLIALALAIVLTGYLAVARPLEARIAERYALLEAARTAIDARRAAVVQLQRALEDRNRLRASLARFQLESTRATSVARLLAAAFAAANRHGATIRGFQAAGATPQPPGGTGPVFDEVPLQLSLRGTYDELLATVRDLAAAPVAARLTIDSLALEDRSGPGTPRLVAAVGIVVLRAPSEPNARTQPHRT
jgi:Tfp pilus assembly protein PilO